MKNRQIYGCFLGLFLYTSETQALTLQEAFNVALKYNQNRDINQARFSSSEAKLDKDEGSYLPKLALKGAFTKIEKQNDSKSLALNLTHNLYKGGKDEIAVEQSKLSLENNKNIESSDELAILKDVVNSYYSYWQNKLDDDNLNLLKDQSEKRRKEISERVKIGRSRYGELLQADSQLAAVEASKVASAGLVNESRKKLSEQLGLSENELVLPNNLEIIDNILSLDEYQKIAAERTDIQARKNKIQISEYDILSAKRNHYPTVDLASNYYLKERAGSLKKSDWDVGVTVSVPLYEGGATEANVRDYVARKLEADLLLNDSLRKIKTDVTQKYTSLIKYREQEKAQNIALSKALANYNESQKDYRLGLLSNLDTLSALNSYLDAKRAYDKVRIQTVLAFYELNVAVGRKP